MLVSVPRVCTALPFVYISSVSSPGCQNISTWVRNLFFICSFFTLHTLKNLYLAPWCPVGSWMGEGGRGKAATTNKKITKILPQNIPLVPPFHLPESSQWPTCFVQHSSFQHPHLSCASSLLHITRIVLICGLCSS